jgi:lipopolysaccharide export system permease protein
MRLLDRYLLRELLIPLGYCLGGFLLLWIVSDLFTMLNVFQQKGIGAAQILDYYLDKAPSFLMIVLPIALLLALLYSLTTHARHHEITAMRAAGISLWRLCAPYLAVGFLFSLASFPINELWAPRYSEAADQMLERRAGEKGGNPATDDVRQLGFTNSRDGRIWHIQLYKPKSGEMFDPEVFCARPDGSYLRIQAARAVYTNGVWVFYKVVEYLEPPGANSLPVPTLETNRLTMPQFSETPELIRSEIQISRSMAIGSAKRPDVPILEILNYLRLHRALSRTDASWLYTKLQGRLAAPWTCLVVVLIAIPFGAASGRRNVFVGVASSLVICFLYFVLEQLSLALGTGGYLPPWLAAWLPNMAFGLPGLWMTARVR